MRVIGIIGSSWVVGIFRVITTVIGMIRVKGY